MPRTSRLALLSPDARRRAEEYRARTERFAVFMRFHPSHYEALMWNALQGSKLGVGFRRQVVLGCPTQKLYIVDFCAPSRKLIVEVDDASHLLHGERDARRDAALRRIGYRVVRIPVALIERNLAEAVAIIRRELG